jgi:hypothetical protein
MRIYIIANDGIMLCRKAPATVNEGEFAVASNAELHAAPLSEMAHNGGEVLAHVGVTPFPRLHTAELSPIGPETADRC